MIGQQKRQQGFFRLFYNARWNLFCSNVVGLRKEIRIPCDPNNWRRLIDTVALHRVPKVVFQPNESVYLSLPFVHLLCFKETYENVKTVPNLLKYEWFI